MLYKLSFRNVHRSIKDYMVYVLTMIIITAFMYAFGSLIFDNELSASFSINGIMQAMIGLSTFFIILIVAWLINYMVRFMLEKRSTEFGVYMLLGMEKKDIAGLYLKENFLLGMFAFVPGIIVGIILKQILTAILYHMIHIDYHFHLGIQKETLLVTLLCYTSCYLLAMLRSSAKFRKMNIQMLMNIKRRNEEIKESHENIRKIILPISILLIIAFWTIFTRLERLDLIMLFMILLIVDIYLFYSGLSAWIICYIRKKKNGIYKGMNLFLFRQFSSKIRTMQFTLGTLTALFTAALMGCSIAMMFSDFENKLLDVKWPFDAQIYNYDPNYDFSNELLVIDEAMKEQAQNEPGAGIQEQHIYRIYTDQKDQANIWMYTNLQAFKNMYRKQDGSVDTQAIVHQLETDGTYCRYDTYMGISDYNQLR
ncbi:MAG: ABC transporter permease, partial [Clostridia bacterium]|nr:ABC transporter permease [Clostridia bacterium]